MSLDIYLIRDRIVSYDGGKTFSHEKECVYEANITHNLGDMADAAGIYTALWRPGEDHYFFAGDIVGILESGLEALKVSPEKFRAFDSKNGWGTYEQFVPFVEEYLKACKEYPGATIEVSR